MATFKQIHSNLIAPGIASEGLLGSLIGVDMNPTTGYIFQEGPTNSTGPIVGDVITGGLSGSTAIVTSVSATTSTRYNYNMSPDTFAIPNIGASVSFNSTGAYIVNESVSVRSSIDSQVCFYGVVESCVNASPPYSINSQTLTVVCGSTSMAGSTSSEWIINLIGVVYNLTNVVSNGGYNIPFQQLFSETVTGSPSGGTASIYGFEYESIRIPINPISSEYLVTNIIMTHPSTSLNVAAKGSLLDVNGVSFFSTNDTTYLGHPGDPPNPGDNIKNLTSYDSCISLLDNSGIMVIVCWPPPCSSYILYNGTDIYFRLSVPQGTASTCDIFVYGSFVY